MIPTIQIVYGSMPKQFFPKTNNSIAEEIRKSLIVDAILEYNEEFYLFKDFKNVFENPAYDKRAEKVLNFLCEQFDCKTHKSFLYFKNEVTGHKQKTIDFRFSNNDIYLYSANTSEVINKLITDDFYDSFQVLLNNLKTQ